MKYVGKCIAFLLFLTFLWHFGQLEKERLSFESKYRAYRDLIPLFYRVQKKPQNLSIPQENQLRKDILIYSKKLVEDGWSYQAIKKGFFKELKPEKTSYSFKKHYQAIHTIGSVAFEKLWSQEPTAQTTIEAERKLKLLLKYLRMPSELSGKSQETKRLLNRFSSELDPSHPFWDRLSFLIQLYYSHEEKIPYTSLNRQIHQLRYLISSQQMQWVRNHFGGQALNDSDALAKYLATLDEEAYSLYESSRYHNKVASVTDQEGNFQPLYSDNKPQSNYKVLVHFHSEFILSESGQFLVALDPDNLTENSIINGASFNYGNQNNDLHKLLDIDPIDYFDPEFIEKVLINQDKPFAVPDIQQQADKHHPIFSRHGKSAKQLIKAAIKQFKKLLEHYQSNQQVSPAVSESH
ncbi:DUF3114 domain-containing protein [Streptococcus ictaluri]|uniref:DUF3114 domain-containing protein n=1 Tax=Streptococcus ictaluri 707-05 TaxID=764299 RepID=G5K5Y7_9STRE|nr:DUF3114 domain-containing protein [Streptococcus ictaluri]EHI68644.1 hypothetical protein STRIC_0474 [Streptococcus ictaluri 707-05]